MMSCPNTLLLLRDLWRRDWTGLADGVGIETPNTVRGAVELAARVIAQQLTV